MKKFHFFEKDIKAWITFLAIFFVGMVFSPFVFGASAPIGPKSLLGDVRSSINNSSVLLVADLIHPGPGKINELDNGQSVIKLDGCQISSRPGEPMLPVRSFSFLLPPHADLERATATVAHPQFEAFPEMIDLAPASPAVYRGPDQHRLMWGNKDASSIKDGRDIRIYENDAFFPEQLVTISSRGRLRDWQLVDVTLYLVRYNPIAQSAELLVGGEVQLNAPVDEGYSAATTEDTAVSVHPSQLDRLRQTIANPGDLHRFYPDNTLSSVTASVTSTPLRLAIVTTEAIRQTATKLPNYINFKISNGYQVRVVTEGQYQDENHYQAAGYSLQRSINIRNWLIAHSSDIDAVLLIGDPRYWPVNPNLSVPMLYCYPFNGDSPVPLQGDGTWIDVPTDMFYAELTGNWDLDGDGIYGEFNGDYGYLGADKLAELHVGRIPFYGNYANLNAILDKFIEFEDMEEAQTTYRQNVLISAAISNFAPRDVNGDGDTADAFEIPTADGKTYGDDWGEEIKSLSSYYGRNPFTLYEKEGRAYPLTTCNAPLTKNNLISQWQTGYGYSTWFAHGGADGAARIIWHTDFFPNEEICNEPTEMRSEAFFEHSDVTQLNQDTPGFAVNLSCLNGHPETTYNLGTRLLQNWAVGAVTASRISVYGFGDWDLTLVNNGLNRGIGYRIYETMEVYSNTLAGALNIARSAIDYSYHGSGAWNNALCYNMYGDPTLKFSSRRLPGEGKVTVQSPNGYNDFYIGQVLSITWTSENITGYVDIDISRDGGLTWQNIIANTPDDGYQGWWATAAESDKCRIRIRSLSVPNVRDISDYNFSISAPPVPAAPTGLVASDGAFTDRVRLTWNPTLYTQYYQIYRGIAGGTIYASLGVSFTTDYDDISASSGRTYSYMVRAVNGLGDTSAFSSPDTGFVSTSITIPSVPTGVNASDGTYVDKVRVSWNPSNGASFYIIYRALSTGGLVIYGQIGQSPAPYFDDTTAEQNTTYSYKVVASNFLFNSGFSAADTGFVALQISLPTTPTGFAASDGDFTDKVRLTWNPASNAIGYKIYRAPAIGGIVFYAPLGSSASSTYDDFTASPGVDYSYRVSSYNAFFESNASAADTGFRAVEAVLPDTPSGIAASDGAYADRISVTWNPASNALFYKVFRGVSSDGTTLYIEIADTPDTAYEDYNTYDKLTYVYKIKAFNDDGSSGFSETDTGYIIDCPCDIDLDGDTDGSDLSILIDGYGSSYYEEDLHFLVEDFGRDDCNAP